MSQNPQQQQNSKKDNSSGLEKYARFSAIAFQMIAVILLFVWGGKKIDEKFFEGRSIFIIVFSLLGVGAALYIVIKDILDITRKK